MTRPGLGALVIFRSGVRQRMSLSRTPAQAGSKGEAVGESTRPIACEISTSVTGDRPAPVTPGQSPGQIRGAVAWGIVGGATRRGGAGHFKVCIDRAPRKPILIGRSGQFHARSQASSGEVEHSEIGQNATSHDKPYVFSCHGLFLALIARVTRRVRADDPGFP
jgi:hypothetical protein